MRSKCFLKPNGLEIRCKGGVENGCLSKRFATRSLNKFLKGLKGKSPD